MKVRVKVDQKLCIGSGSCMVIASAHFSLNKKGKAEIKQSENDKSTDNELVINVSSAEKKQLLEAAQACPSQAISIVDENGKKIY